MISRLKNIRESLSGQLTMRVVMLAAVLFFIASVVFLRMVDRNKRKEAVKSVNYELTKTINRIDAVLNSVELALENTAWLVPYRKDLPEFMYGLTRKFVENNPFIYSCAIGFEPYYYENKGEFFLPFSYREGDTIVTTQIGGKEYDYHYLDWYQLPKLLGKPCWNEPYYDYTGRKMMTYSIPLYDENGEFYAVIEADITLDWLTDIVNAVNPYPNSYTIMISRNASFIVHPNENFILNETLFSTTYGKEVSESMRTLQDDMINMRKGMAMMSKEEVSFKDCYVFYSPIETTNWSVAIVCPEDEVLSDVKIVRNNLIINTLIALVIMIIFCYINIRRIVDPISDFSVFTKEISNGDFSAPLPDIKTRGELKVLYESFDHMKESLINYIDELKFTTINQERMESELRIASAIQMEMLPCVFPPFPNRNDVDLFAKMIPAKEVGGDLYDCFIKEEKLYFIIGDVSGKGVPAALIMTVICSLFRTLAPHAKESDKIIGMLNKTMSTSNDMAMFCTMFVGVLDLKTAVLDYCNAGHNTPYIINENGVVPMEIETNISVGLFEDFEFVSQTYSFVDDSYLFLYTDGVTEAENADKELYNEQRMVEHLIKADKTTAMTIINDVLADVAKHSGDTLQSDDITMLCVNYKKL